jgi:hypothetical protein
MIEYHKINTIFKRDEKTNRLIIGEYSQPEFEYLANNKWDFSEKIDGTNIRIGWSCLTKTINFGGRHTENSQIPKYLLVKLQELFTMDKLNSLFPDTSVILFGEGYGSKIQKGGELYKSDGVDFILFDVLIGEWWLKRNDVDGIATSLGIKAVPIIDTGTFEQAIELVSNGFNSTFGKFKAEGIVMRPAVELFSHNRKRIIAKLKTRDFT